MTYSIVLMFHVFLAVAMTGLILLQHGKGADAGAAFGAGSSGTVFGARGAANFLSRSTAVLAALFVITSLSLAHFIQRSAPTSVIESMSSDETPAIIATADESEAVVDDTMPVLNGENVELPEDTGMTIETSGDLPDLVVTPVEQPSTGIQ